MENPKINNRGADGAALPPPPPLNHGSSMSLLPAAEEFQGEELTVFPAPATPWLSRVRKGWNELMLMGLSAAATLGTGGAIGLLLWWLAGEAGVRP